MQMVCRMKCTRVSKNLKQISSEMTHTYCDCIMQFTEINGDKMNNGLFLWNSTDDGRSSLSWVSILLNKQMIQRWEMILIRSIKWVKRKAINNLKIAAKMSLFQCEHEKKNRNKSVFFKTIEIQRHYNWMTVAQYLMYKTEIFSAHLSMQVDTSCNLWFLFILPRKFCSKKNPFCYFQLYISQKVNFCKTHFICGPSPARQFSSIFFILRSNLIFSDFFSRSKTVRWCCEDTKSIINEEKEKRTLYSVVWI